MTSDSFLMVAVIGGFVVGIAFVTIIAVFSMAPRVQSLVLVPVNSTTAEDWPENERLLSISRNYAIVKDALRKAPNEESLIDNSPQTLAKFKNIEDAKAVIQYVITKGLYLGDESGVKITMVIDSNDLPAITYVKCLGPDYADIHNADIGKPSNTVEGCL